MNIDFPTQSQLPQLRSLWKLAFGDSDAYLDGFYATGYAPQRCRCLTVEGQVAAALYWFDVAVWGRKMAYLYAVATHPDHRNRGLCRALLTDTHGLLPFMGYAGALLVPEGETLRQMYGRFGYQNCGGILEISAKAAKSPVPVEKISIDTFARLRRERLPEGGAVQEGANLSYLSTFSGFFAGEDFLLAAAPREGALHGMELLGNATAAPGILAVLGYETGTFRIPGQTPFAMWLPLSEEATAPAYFGLDLA